MKNMKYASKRLFTLALALILTFALVPAIIAAEPEPILDPGITIRANDELRQPTDSEGNPVYPILYNGTTYIPVRGLSYLLGKTVAWVSDTRTIAITDTPVTAPPVKTAVPPAAKTLTGVRPDQSIKITYNGAAKQLADVNGSPVYPILYNGTNYAPLRGALGLFGITPEYDGATKTISFTQTAETGVMRDITAAQLVAEMGLLNTNHARALDRIDYDYKVGYATDPNPGDPYSKVQWITLWTDGVTASVPAEFAGQNRFSGKGSPLTGFGEFYTLEKFSQVISEFKNAGYKAVRLPVSWTYWTNSTTHEIDKEWMDLVEICVKIILDNDLYCIINAHEDYMGQSWVGDHWADDWMLAQYKDYVNTRYVAIWKQVAERFRGYGDHLLFESFNEPSDRKRDYLPYDQIVKNGIARVNEMQALFVKTVRESGGNNAKRFLSLTHFMSMADHIGLNMLDTIDLPQDKNIIVQTHYYFHSEDGNAVRAWNRNNASDRALIDRNFALIKQFMDKTGIPVILGEFANTEWLSTRDRIDQATYILEKTKELGVPVFWWEATMDTDWDKTGYDGAFSLYNRNKMAWEHPDILKAIMQTVNG
jgi:endoglucanase